MAVNAIDLQPYVSLNDEDCEQRMQKANRTPGDSMVISGHHHQPKEFLNKA